MRGKTPWDDGSTPSEVIDFIDTHPPGRAVDLGCGSGTHALALAEKGWDVTGIDFAAQAIRIARRRAVQKGLGTIFVHGDVTCPGCLDGPYDFALDVGCLFALKSDERAAYAGHLSRLLKSGAWYLLFAWLPRFVNGRPWGISPEGVDLLLASHFRRTRMTIGEEKGVSAAWYWYCRW
ncbi:hypothetical protein DSCO28_28750 [Desulfosarcina ovata subsp. sediminis]|uniref:Methyltransferase domain-containing protein n=2 Tax=Desulfosarcina ovata TaxID=83564 RepID=A0A5K7ZQ95_9BACT|nr:hypothetical protein DSCO28_28750 [Desulfosarcina ovata subsp. sediminis]